MALSRYMMQRILNEDGHLIVEGDESQEELREALCRLFSHSRAECAYQYPPSTDGRMLYEVIPDIRALHHSSTYRHPRKNRKITDVETTL